MPEETHDEIIAQDSMVVAVRTYSEEKNQIGAFDRARELNRVRNIRLTAERYERVIKDAMKLELK